MIKKLLFTFLVAVSFNSFAQDTYTQVYNILQNKCADCHGATSPAASLNLTGSTPADVYTALVNANPVNAVALAKGNKLVVPGDIFRSFLYRKLIQHADVDGFTRIEADSSEGLSCPQSPNVPISNYEVELIRQWILEGADQTGTSVDTAMINTFYTVGGVNMNSTIPAGPPSGEGTQYHFGRVFLAPSTEREMFLKINPMISTGIEINKIEVYTPLQTHHFVIYKFFTGADANFSDGLRGLDQSSHGSGDAISGFRPGLNVLDLPTGKAYVVPGNTIFDYNLHIVNNNPDSVLAIDIYINFYTQPMGTVDPDHGYMYTRNFPNFDIAIPHDNQPHSFTTIANDAAGVETNYWVIWSLYSHTHRYGVDYDIFLRNPDGTQGEQAYEGWYNQDYTFNQGYYTWGVGSPQRFFDEPDFLVVDPRLGFFQTATFVNTAGPDTVFFGTTSLEEMMVMGFQYFYGDPLPLSVNEQENNLFKIYPNPASTQLTMNFNDIKCQSVWIYDASGRLVSTNDVSNKTAATLDVSSFSSGLYFYRAFDKNNGVITSGKFNIAR